MVIMTEKYSYITYPALQHYIEVREEGSLILEYKEIFPACLVLLFGYGQLKNGRGFFLFGSWMERVWSMITSL